MCIICESVKDLISKIAKNSASAKEHVIKTQHSLGIMETSSHMEILITPIERIFVSPMTR
jgi:GMP synthase PP-ATPase subunit